MLFLIGSVSFFSHSSTCALILMNILYKSQKLTVSLWLDLQIPTTLGEEKETNPFLRPFSAELRKTMKVPVTATDIDTFAAVRAAKDRA